MREVDNGLWVLTTDLAAVFQDGRWEHDAALCKYSLVSLAPRTSKTQFFRRTEFCNGACVPSYSTGLWKALLPSWLTGSWTSYSIICYHDLHIPPVSLKLLL